MRSSGTAVTSATGVNPPGAACFAITSGAVLKPSNTAGRVRPESRAHAGADSVARLPLHPKDGALCSSSALSARPQDAQRRVRMQLLSDAKRLITVAEYPGAKS